MVFKAVQKKQGERTMRDFEAQGDHLPTKRTQIEGRLFSHDTFETIPDKLFDAKLKFDYTLKP